MSYGRISPGDEGNYRKSQLSNLKINEILLKLIKFFNSKAIT